MSSSNSSEDSEQKAISDRKVDAYFPTPIDPNEIPQVTEKGYKPITRDEERNLLEQGIMTYYNGHLDSKCCEACNDALWTSDKYARGKHDLRPVHIQKHKYIDKRTTDCVKYKDRLKVPSQLKTGFQTLDSETKVKPKDKVCGAKKHRTDAEDFRDKEIIGGFAEGEYIKGSSYVEFFDEVGNYVEGEYVGDDVNIADGQYFLDDSDKPSHETVYAVMSLYSALWPLNRIPRRTLSAIDNVMDLVHTILDHDLSRLFYESSPRTKHSLRYMRSLIVIIINNIKSTVMSLETLDEDFDFYSVFTTIMLVMFAELILRKVVVDHLLSFLKSLLSRDFNLTFKKMVTQLALLPILKVTKRSSPKVKFNLTESSDSKENKDFICKRKKFDLCPCELRGKRFSDKK